MKNRRTVRVLLTWGACYFLGACTLPIASREPRCPDVQMPDRAASMARAESPTLHSWELDKIGKHSLCIRANLMASSHTFSKTPRSSHMYMLNISPALRNLRNHPELACACCSTQAVRATAALKVLPDIAYLI